jgi:DNA helicase-2/ATP-dependent DNA helicase PcrA
MLKLCNALDFNDLLAHTVTLLDKCSDILTQLQGQRPFLLVDEFQDSNKPQVCSDCVRVCGRAWRERDYL